MSGVPYVPRECIVAFREPFPRRKRNGLHWTYYIKASIDGMPDQEVRFNRLGLINLVDSLIQVDGKILGAVVSVGNSMEIIQHSPQHDFFSIVEGKNVSINC